MRDSTDHVEVVIKFRTRSGDYEYDVNTEKIHIEEAAKELAENLKKYGYHFHDVKRLSSDQDTMKRHFIIVLHGRQTVEELKRRLESMHGNRSWTYCEVF